MKFFRTIYPTLFWLIIIWILSSIPSQDLPSVNIVGFDKLQHLGVYAVLGCLIGYWLRFKNWDIKKIVLIYLGLIVLAGIDEYHQRYIPGRDVSIYDFLANASGLIIGFLLYLRKYDRS
ncbi:MAG TPA: VanZ family protein [Candidatus Cloacimonas sp.]|jgi:VanZ family protein|nr:VanZ family protein [Candidatus Cloacimonas sp.]MDD2249813.1 VanZ family protein [Candidatus Cloacimonadota bacterium]MCK9164328.1 VanZ family protein [Candidatus Cloacimonas sp.]MDD3733592.1 VanZ family protein [Candidatus Cloacimonadota bacterium]MDD3870349.1 VanZ family protein [Candidatus Cloacimonadota bacterium]